MYHQTKSMLRYMAGTLALFFAAAMFLCFPQTASASRAAAKDGEVSYNVGRQNYNTWSAAVKSYLYETEDGNLTRVEALQNKIVVETYSADFKRINKKTVPMELDLFGGFYAGSDGNYLVFGQRNPKENSSLEVYRIVKYSKKWKRIASCGLTDCNTTVPFDAGSLRMTQSGNMLYIRTCHEMYKSDDGRNHQANLTMAVNTSSMKITDSFSRVMNLREGYVSHSFNQFIIAAGSTLVAADHGDAYPRSMVLIRYDAPAGGETLIDFTNVCSHVDLLSFPGKIGDNYTGGSMGGLNASDTHYLTVGNYANTADKKIRNVYLTATDASAFSEEATRLVYLSSYKASGKKTASTPHLVKINANRFMALWEENQADYSTKGNIGTVKYVLIDGTGAKVSSVMSINGRLSDCAPVLYQNRIVWYYTDKTAPVFCSLSTDGKKETSGPIKGEWFTSGNLNYRILSVKGKTGKVTIEGATEYDISELTIPESVKKEGVTFKITQIEPNAFSGYHISKVKVKTKNLVKVGTGAFSYNGLSITIQAPKAKVSAYKKLFTAKKIGRSSVKVVGV